MPLDRNTLPATIRITDMGIGESPYDMFGEEAPGAYECRSCWAKIGWEYFDDDIEDYRPVSDRVLQSFVDRHTDCKKVFWPNEPIIEF